MMTLMQAAQQKKDDQNQPQSKNRREKQVDNIHISPISGFICTLAYIAAIVGAVILDGMHAGDTITAAWVIVFTLFGFYILFALKVAQQWEKAVVLRLGKFHAPAGCMRSAAPLARLTPAP